MHAVKTSNTSAGCPWYHFAGYDAVSDVIASAISEIYSGLHNAEVGHSIYCFDKVKSKRVL